MVVNSIERYYIAGVDHMIDEEFNRKYNKMNCCTSCMSITMLIAIFITLAIYTFKYFELTSTMTK